MFLIKSAFYLLAVRDGLQIYNLFSSHFVGAFTREQQHDREEDAFFSWRQLGCGLKSTSLFMWVPTALSEPRFSLSPCKPRSPNWKGKLFSVRRKICGGKQRAALSFVLSPSSASYALFLVTQRSLRSLWTNTFFFEHFLLCLVVCTHTYIYTHIYKKTLFAPSSATLLCLWLRRHIF